MTESRDIRATVTWRRLDLPGREESRLERTAGGWALRGVATFTYRTDQCRLEYVITGDDRWQTERCTVTGFVAGRAVSLEIARHTDGRWTVNGDHQEFVAGCVDLDLAFSPVTNLLPIRRLELLTGARAKVRAAWLRFPEFRLEPLDQVYTRVAADRYLYASADGTFRRELTVSAAGFVLDYPGQWVAESSSEAAPDA